VLSWRADVRSDSGVRSGDGSSRSMNLPQHPPRSHELLNRCRWWKSPASICAVPVGILVDLLDARYAQHRQTAGVVSELFPGQDRLWLRAACHDQILTDSLFVRHWIFAGSWSAVCTSRRAPQKASVDSAFEAWGGALRPVVSKPKKGVFQSHFFTLQSHFCRFWSHFAYRKW
jgi:hypothetical protein